MWREYPSDPILRAWMKSNKVTRVQLMSPMKKIKIQIYHLNFRECFSKHWSYLGRSTATRELGKHDFMITYRKPPSLKDMLVRARIAQPTTTFIEGCNRPSTCKYCIKISQWGRIKNLNNNKSCNTITNSTCQSKNLIYCSECNWCHIRYVGQT